MGQLSLSTTAAVHLWVQVAALFVLARLLGAAGRRLGQPEVVGSLLAGVILGPSVLGAVWPAATTFMLPPGEGSQLLGAVSGFCLLMVLIMLGAETDLPLLRRLGRAVIAVSAGGIVIPLVAGSAVAYLFAAPLVPAGRLAGSILIGGALAVSSLPIIARLVVELGVARRDFGQLAFASATVNDIYGFLLLVGVSAAAEPAGLSGVLLPAAGLLLFVAVFVLFGQRLVDDLLRRVRRRGPNPSGSLAVVIAVALASAAALQAFHVEAALGAFFAGVMVGRSRFQHSQAMRQLDSFCTAVFAPLYFAGAGLQVDLGTLNSPSRIGALLALLTAAVASKAAGSALGARYARLAGREIGALAILLNGRGALQVIIGTAGLRTGLLSPAAYTILMVVSIASSVLVSPVLRRFVGNWPGNEEERRRLAHEERLRSNVLVRGQRLLVPTSIGTTPATAATLLDRAWPPEAELTVLATPAHPADRVTPAVTRTVRDLTVDTPDPVAAVLAEANLGYGIISVGIPGYADTADDAGDPAADRARGHVGTLATDLLNQSPLPVMLVRPAGNADGGHGDHVGDPRRVAVAVTGTTASRAAEEIAQNLCARNGARLDIVHVVPATSRSGGDEGAQRERFADANAHGVLREARGRATAAGLRPHIARRSDAGPPGGGLAGYIRDHGIDLLIVGTRLRRVQGRPFLGHTVEELLRHDIDAGLAVVALPDTTITEADQPYTTRDLA